MAAGTDVVVFSAVRDGTGQGGDVLGGGALFEEVDPLG